MAIFNSLIGVAVLAMVRLSQVANADVLTCTLAPNSTDVDFGDINSMIVHSQEYLDQLLNGCTDIIGGLAIAPDYNGTFSLPNITTFTGEGIWQLSPGATPGLTDFDFPDMIILSQINLEGILEPISVSMPYLEQIETLVLLGNSTVEVDCGSLINADTIIIEGVAPVLNFTSLRQVNEMLSIQAGPDDTDNAPSSTLNFDSLMNATSIYIGGHIAELNMPNLETALSVDSDIYNSYGIDIESYGSPLIVNFPSLYNASGIKLEGNFQSLSFPSMLELDGVFALYSALPFAVNFTTLRAVLAIDLAGKISSFSMLSITTIQSWVEVISSVDIDCSVASGQYASVSTAPFISSVGDTHVFTCRSTAKHSMSTGKKVGLAFGILAILGVLLGTSIWALKNYWGRKGRGKRGNVEETAVGTGGCELGDMYKGQGHVVASERPPPYAASVHSDLGPLAEPKSAF